MNGEQFLQNDISIHIVYHGAVTKKEAEQHIQPDKVSSKSVDSDESNVDSGESHHDYNYEFDDEFDDDRVYSCDPDFLLIRNLEISLRIHGLCSVFLCSTNPRPTRFM